MEVFYVMILGAILYLIAYFIMKLYTSQLELTKLNYEILHSMQRIELDVNTQLNLINSLSAETPQPPISPLKTNNWDSMRKVFTMPIRNDNERT